MSVVVLSVGSVAGINGVDFTGTVSNAFELNTDWLREATRLSISEMIDYSEVRYALSKQEYLKFDESVKFDYDSLKTVCKFVTSDDFKLELLDLEEKEIKGGNKMKLNIQLFDGENKNLGGVSMNRTMEIVNRNLNKNKEESVDMSSRREFLKEEVLKEVTTKKLIENAKLLTNFNVGNEELILKAFSYLLELVMSDKEGFAYDVYNSMTNSLIMGKKEKFRLEYATKYASLYIGTESKIKDALAFVATKKEREVIVQKQLPKEIALVNNKILSGTATMTTPIHTMELFNVIKHIANKYGMTLLSNGEIKNGYTIAILQDKVDKFLKVRIPMPEIFVLEGKYFTTGVNHRTLRLGNDIYAGSVNLKVKNTLTETFTNEELIYGQFNDTVDNFLNLIERVCQNKEFLDGKDFSGIFFNPKEESDSHVTRAFFVRVGSLDEIFSNYKKDSFRKVQKTHRLVGMMLEIDKLAYDSFVLDEFNPSRNEELFVKLTNNTLGGGAGLGAIQYKTVNNLQRILISSEDKIKANPFAMNPYTTTKGSRNNNPDSVYLDTKNTIDFYNFEGFKVPHSNKMSFTVFMNMDKIKNWKDGETKPANSLDNYIATRDFFENFMTEQRLEDKKKYYTLDIKNEELKELVLDYIENNPHDEDVRGYMLNNYPELKAAALRIRKPITRIVDKLSNSGLKGIVVETKTDLKVEILDDKFKHLEAFANENLLLSNNTLKKPEWAITIASGLQDSVSNQMKEGKTELEFAWPKSIDKKLSKNDLIKVNLIVEGVKYETYAVLSPVNMHDSKNNYAAQGDSTIKQTMFNIQVLNAVKGNVRPWFFKSNSNLVKSIIAAGYELVYGKWIVADNSKEYTVSVMNLDNTSNLNKSDEFDQLKSNFNLIKSFDNNEADLILGAKPFENNKEFVMNKNGVVYQFVETANTNDHIYIKERNTLSIPDHLLRKIYSDDEMILSEEMLMSRSGSDINNITVLDALALMSSKNITPLLDANPTTFFHDKIDAVTGVRTEGLLDCLSKQRVIDLKGLKIGFEPSMKKISTFFSKELNTAIRAAKELYSDNSLDNFIELIDNKVITDLSSFFKVLEERHANGDKGVLNTFFNPTSDLVTQFDKEHNIGGNYVLKNEIKEKVVKLTQALTAMFNYHRERLFSKDANEAFFNKQDAFYGTVVSVDVPVNEVHINPNSQGINREMAKKIVALFDRKPNTGEFGYGLKLVWDKTVPENCICVSPILLEQNMGDNDGDCGFVYFVEERIATTFKHLKLDEKDYYAIYDIKVEKFFDKWNNTFDGKLDLGYDNILAIHNSERKKMLFNPEFVGLITSMNMTLADICWKEFVEGKVDEDKKNGLEVYNFFINIVQKQLSQIPIAAKNTSAEDLAEFKNMMSNLNDLATYEKYEEFVNSLDSEDDDFDHKRTELNSYSKFIFVTGWGYELDSLGLVSSFEN